MASQHLGNDIAPKVLESILSSKNGIVLEPLKVTSEMDIADSKVNEIDFDTLRLLLFGVIKENGQFLFNPKSDFMIKEGEILLLFGRPDNIDRLTHISL
jgi:uncharacterized protein with PhoU and TrkA domain